MKTGRHTSGSISSFVQELSKEAGYDYVYIFISRRDMPWSAARMGGFILPCHEGYLAEGTADKGRMEADVGRRILL